MPERPASVPSGVRVYAIGDIHGRRDLLDQLLLMVDADIAGRGIRRPILLFLGDYIDRGPSSAQVLDRLIDIGFAADPECYFLMGNHEEVLLRLLNGDVEIFPNWMRFGGRECLDSYGADSDDIAQRKPEELRFRLRATIPRRHREFLSRLDDTVRIGDYLFVHAGLRPGRSLAAQSQDDLRWIRSPFLEDEEADHGFMVVHGHTITQRVVRRRNRIGIDTGAYHSGHLTALVLEGSDQRILQTSQVTQYAR
nr:metallophosphoesterase [uncultured Sphingomonas sp.]